MPKVYVYCPRGSTGAFALVKAIGGVRLRKFDGMDFWDKAKRIKPEQGSVIVCWGASVPEIEGIRVLNSADAGFNKYNQAKKFVAAGVATVTTHDGTGCTAGQLRQAGYVPRAKYHTGGLDLLDPPKVAGFWVLKENFVAEYRVHSFAGRSIRAGQKVVREGFKLCTEKEWKPEAGLAHPWIRSYDGGWKISHNGFKSTAQMRALAHAAVKALGLTFGAVDIGQTQYGDLKVLEVNTSPGIEGASIEAYVKAINRWIEEKPAEGE